MSIKDSTINNTITREFPERGMTMSPLNKEISNNKMFCKIAFDYLSFSLPYSMINRLAFDEICNLLLLDQSKADECAFGKNGYSSSKRWKNELNQDKETYTEFFYNGSEATNNTYGERTGMFLLSGDGCRALESRGDNRFPDYWKEIFLSLNYSTKLRHVSITRFDFAIDVFNAEFKIQDIVKAINDRNLLTPFLRYEKTDGGEFISDNTDKNIIYLGSKNSDLFLCIYDKKEEREAIGKTIDFDSWYRFEFRFKHDKAKNFILNILDRWDNPTDIAVLASELILKYCDIKIRPSQGKNSIPGTLCSKDTMRKWDTNPKWLNFIGTSKKADIVNYYKYESSITKNAIWMTRSVSKTLSKLYLANPEYFYLFLQRCTSEGLTRLKNTDVNYINDFRKKHSLSKLTNRDIDLLAEDLKLNVTQAIEDLDVDVLFDDDGQMRGF